MRTSLLASPSELFPAAAPPQTYLKKHTHLISSHRVVSFVAGEAASAYLQDRDIHRPFFPAIRVIRGTVHAWLLSSLSVASHLHTSSVRLPSWQGTTCKRQAPAGPRSTRDPPGALSITNQPTDRPPSNCTQAVAQRHPIERALRIRSDRREGRSLLPLYCRRLQPPLSNHPRYT